MSTPAQSSSVGLSGIARRLVSENILSEADVRKAMAASLQQQTTLTAYLLDHHQAESRDLTRIMSEEFGLPRLDVTALAIAQMPVGLISEELINKHRVLPLFKRGNRLFVGVTDPMQSLALDEIKFHTNCTVEPILVERDALLHAIDTMLNTMSATLPDLEEATLTELDGDGIDAGIEVSGIDATADDDSPIVKFVNKVLVDAIRRGASDIHFEPFETQYRIRLRIDGILVAVSSPPMNLASRITSRLKVMASLDIAERRVPQDGRIKLNLSKTHSVDFRVSSLPTLFGEKVVLRILDSSAAKLGIDTLGYEEIQKQLYLEAIHRPYGMVLVTGPTGSGKTVSLYTALNILNTDERNISTVEDPVEIRLEGINQVQQNVKRGMTFAAALRSFLRQDPDVIMVGEIRDLETAEIAIKAAQTGHMVLSTLHTNDAPQTISRLMNMGIAPYNITSSVALVVAQRLARRLHDCKRPMILPPETLLAAGFTQQDIAAGLTIYEAVGCEGCNGGYKGRVGIYQVMPMIEEIQQIVLHGGNTLQITEAARKAGVEDLRASGLRKVKGGITSLVEVDRVTKD